MNDNNQELTGIALLRYIMRRFNKTRSAALGSMPEEHRTAVLKEEQELQAERDAKVKMPSHTEVAIEVDKIVDGWSDCDSSHNREDLDDLISDLCQYRESIATTDEYFRANQL